MNFLNKEIVNFSVGANHSAFLTSSGYLITMGKNDEGQRGLGHTKLIVEPTIVKLISDKFITVSFCSII